MITFHEIWRRLTTTRYARALEEEILPHMRAQEAEIARQRIEIERRSGEVAQQREQMERQCEEIDRLQREDRQHRAEIVRLRAENRSLLNSILGIAGVPPIVVADPLESETEASAEAQHDAAGTHAECSIDSSSAPVIVGRIGVAAHPKNATLVAPTRRRSWQQIHRALEFAAVQKKDHPGNAPMNFGE